MQAAIDAIIRCQQLSESEAVRYAAELLDFDSLNGTGMAPQFRKDVLDKVQQQEYGPALIGLDRFVADFLDLDPLMRIDFSGLTQVLRPALALLFNAQENGLDVSG